MIQIIKYYKLHLFVALLSMAFYTAFAYDLDRSDFVKLLTLYGGLFYVAYLAIEKWRLSFRWLLVLGILFRLVFLVTIPNLSQDFYRFLWDGRLLARGLNPYLFTPEAYFTDSAWSVLKSENLIAQAETLYSGMGALNGSHYSNYPPVNQLFFALAALIGGKSIFGSVAVLRVSIIAADIGILYFGQKLLKKLNIPIRRIFWYFLSPFIIIEMTGNLHFESVMLFFLIWALYLLYKGNRFWAAVLLGVSVSVKLLPLLFLPLFLGWFLKEKQTVFEGVSNLVLFYVVTLSTVVISFAPFLSSEFISNFSTTIGLWFQNFEFNASIYYIIRWIGFEIVGYNIIGIVGKVLPIVVTVIIFALAFFRKNTTMPQLVISMLFAVSCYFLLSTTVHPWYIATPLLLSVFTNYKFPIMWSAAVVLSYAAYGSAGFDENLWLVAVEYILLIGFAIFELKKKKMLLYKE